MLIKNCISQIIFVKEPPSNRCFDAHKHIKGVSGIQTFKTDSVVLNDGTEEPVDAVIFCTGYVFDMPFLHEKCKIKTTHGRIYPLYHHLINCHYPSMAIIGALVIIPHIRIAVPAQVHYYKAFLDGKFTLPSTKEMVEETDKEYEDRLKDGLKPHYAHRMFPRLAWPHVKMLGKYSGFDCYEPYMPALFEHSFANVIGTPCDFRGNRYQRINPEEFMVERRDEHGEIKREIIGINSENNLGKSKLAKNQF